MTLTAVTVRIEFLARVLRLVGDNDAAYIRVPLYRTELSPRPLWPFR